MKARCGLYALSFGLLCSALLTPFFASSASAWSGDLPECADFPDFTSKLKQDSRYDKNKTAYLAFKRAWTGPPYYGAPAVFVVWDITQQTSDNKITFYVSGSNRTVNLAPGNLSSAYVVENNGDLSPASGTGGGGFSDFTCISVAQKVIYDTSWVSAGAQTFPTEKDGNLDPAVACGFADIPCWLGSLGTQIIGNIQDFWNGTVSIFEKLLQFLGAVFIPSDQNLFLNAFNTLNDYLQAKLGFLTFPVVFITDQFSALISIVTTESGPPSYGYAVCAPNIAGTELCIDLLALQKTFPSIWDTGVIFLRISVMVVLIELMRKKHESITKG